VDALATVVRAGSTRPLHVVRQLADIPAKVVEIARPGDLVITLGAGSIGGVGDRILAALDGEAGTER
jgi:UDP-N-acetylmuramate--alanine ligase